jgi:hypothetical protein
MATLVQGAHTGVSGTTCNVTLGTGGTTNTGTPATAGNTIIAYATAFIITGRTITTSDNVNAGNYSQDSFGNGTSNSLGIYSLNNCLGGNTTVTMTVSGASTSIGLIVEEWSGILIPTPFDKPASGAAIAGSGNVTSSSTGALSQATEVALACCATATSQSGGLLVQSPFTVSTANGNQNSQSCGNYQPNSASALTVTFNLPVTSNWQIRMATYKLAAVGAPPPFYNRRSVLYFT